jgi:hypothetical protein
MSTRTRSQTRSTSHPVSELTKQQQVAKISKRAAVVSSVSATRAEAALAKRGLGAPLKEQTIGEITVFLNPDNSVRIESTPPTFRKIAKAEAGALIQCLALRQRFVFKGEEYNTVLVLKNPLLNSTKPETSSVILGYLVGNVWPKKIFKLHSVYSTIPDGEAVFHRFLTDAKQLHIENVGFQMSEPPRLRAIPADTNSSGVFIFDVAEVKDVVKVRDGVSVTLKEVNALTKSRYLGNYDPNQLVADITAAAYNNVCSGSVREGYIIDQILNNPIRMLLRWRLNNTGPLVPIGFVLARVDDHNADSIYIDIICAAISGGGKLLLDSLIEYATHYGKNVSLSALPTVLSYYPIFKFKHRQSCAPGVETFVFPRDVKPPPSLLDSYKIPAINNFMITLADHDLASKNDCKGVKRKMEKGKYYREDPSAFAQENCAQDGFYMMRCKDDLK